MMKLTASGVKSFEMKMKRRNAAVEAVEAVETDGESNKMGPNVKVDFLSIFFFFSISLSSLIIYHSILTDCCSHYMS